jgi:hypothetical protein
MKYSPDLVTRLVQQSSAGSYENIETDGKARLISMHSMISCLILSKQEKECQAI